MRGITPGRYIQEPFTGGEVDDDTCLLELRILRRCQGVT